MQEIKKLALAGLLHDIGKFCLRASVDYKNCINYREFKYKHACLSYYWILEHKELENLGIDIKQLASLAAKHHKPTNELETIIHLADRFSSSEREKILQDEINYLHSVFERVSFEKEVQEGSKFFAYYKLEPLSLEKDKIFPESIEGIFEEKKIKPLNEEEKRKLEEKLGNYKDLYDKFEEEFKKINNFKNENAFVFLYYLLQKYLWCVPASTFDQENYSRHYPDISLFDHSRILSAIATSIYDYYRETRIKLDFNTLKKENFLLFVEGDITGIQKFIYNIGKTQKLDNFSISKALRGRSFLVSLIPEIISRYILKELEYLITNAVYVGGGKFQLLLANTEKNRLKLEEIEEKINEFFFNEYHGELGLVLAYNDFNGEYLTEENNKSFADIVENLQIILDEKKKQKFKHLLCKDLETEIFKGVCPSCKTFSILEENKICKLCEQSNEIGSELPKINYLVFDLNKKDINNVLHFKLGDFGKVYLVKNDKEIDKFKDCTEILLLNSTNLDKNNGFKFIGNTVPLINKENRSFFESLEENEEEKKEIKEDQVVVVEFKYLAKLSHGDQKLGIFRADVDNLGLIFSDGLKRKIKEESNRYTISRIATLSRMLDLFFSGYINKLAEETINENLPEGLTSINSLVYIVYSGGDDLFTIAPYNVSIEFARRVREELYKFSGGNLDFGISGGIFITSPTMPIHLSAKYSENLESKSKRTFYRKTNEVYFKDSISIFNKTYKWKEFKGKSSLENLVESELKKIDDRKDLGEKQKEEIKNKLLSNLGLSKRADLIYFDIIIKVVDRFVKYRREISRGFLYRLLEYYQIYIKDGKYINAGIYPKIYYQIARNFKEKDKKDVRNFLENLLIKEGYEENGKILLKKEDVIKNLDVIISLVLMKTRGGK